MNQFPNGLTESYNENVLYLLEKCIGEKKFNRITDTEVNKASVKKTLLSNFVNFKPPLWLNI